MQPGLGREVLGAYGRPCYACFAQQRGNFSVFIKEDDGQPSGAAAIAEG